ncbi:trehalose-phosphatase [Algoriphagus resistens]|uniref:trehalose-phosphatase n=1 Tax=Algoriphagus resistens TaxID=1750590 RepID=UPI000716990F|nr:trehalose-phosphatase [Algoriphagus resistens]
MTEIRNTFKAIILDMDGVVTQTATLHAEAWKQMFDSFLESVYGENFHPLVIGKDYKHYIDGIPRYDGVRGFLKSRNLEIPEGNPGDYPDHKTVHGLGNKKNEIFLGLLKTQGAQVYKDALAMLKIWKKEKIKLAIISSSRNCSHVIHSAGLTEYFDTRVDGELSEKENLAGKPAPDIFLKACELLNVEPHEAIVIEDAIAGIKAGKRGGFAVVIGVARHGEGRGMKEAGADIVVKELTELENITQLERPTLHLDLPDALENFQEIAKSFEEKRPILFLDYDGTLTPIVSNPKDAVLSEVTKKIIKDLSEYITIAIISGRDRKDAESMIGLPNLIYAGSHGFDIKGPNGLQKQHEQGQETLPALDKAEARLIENLANVASVQVERKKYAIAVHYRNVEKESIEQVKSAVAAEAAQHPKLKKGYGKKILELKPDLDWDKGKALRWLMEELRSDTYEQTPVFIGDDITDEDAFKAIRGKGTGIIVGAHDEETAASYSLQNVDEVNLFLTELKRFLSERKEM